MKALRQLEYAKPLQVCDLPVPEAVPGTAVVRIIAAGIISYLKNVYNGERKYPYPTPLTTGTSAIGRIHSLGPDNTSLGLNQLVLFDITIRSRSDPTHVFLSAIHEGGTPNSTKLMSYWRNGTYAEYLLSPLESLYPISDSVLLPESQGGQGYTITDLLHITKIMVPYGGFSDIGLKPGETVIIAPATGGFGSAAVHIALSLGARVIAMGRNTTSLSALLSALGPKFPKGRLITCPISGDVHEQLEAIKKATGPVPIDVFFDISPPIAANAPFFKANILALRHSGRVSLMGGQLEDIVFPYRKMMRDNITIKSKWMYEPGDVRHLIKMVETGCLVLGERGGVPTRGDKAFKLEEWEEGFDYAEEKNLGLGVGGYFVIGEDEAGK